MGTLHFLPSPLTSEPAGWQSQRGDASEGVSSNRHQISGLSLPLTVRMCPPRPTPTWGQLLPRDTLLALWGLKKGECGGGELLLVSHSDMVEPGKGLLSAPQPLPWQAGKLSS